MKPSIWNCKPLNVLATLATQTLTFRVPLPVLWCFWQDTCNSCKILAAFNFVCPEPCEVKVSDTQAIFLDLNFTGKTSGWGSDNFKNKAKQKKKKQPTKPKNPPKTNQKTTTPKNQWFLPCHFKLFFLLWRTLSHEFRSLCQKHLLPFLRKSAWFWPNYKFLKNEFPQLIHRASNLVNVWRLSCMNKFKLLVALKGMGLQMCCPQRTFPNVLYQSRIMGLKVDTPYDCCWLLLVKTLELRNRNFWCSLR